MTIAFASFAAFVAGFCASCYRLKGKKSLMQSITAAIQGGGGPGEEDKPL